LIRWNAPLSRSGTRDTLMLSNTALVSDETDKLYAGLTSALAGWPPVETAMQVKRQEEDCPVPDSVLGDIYRTHPQGLRALAKTIPPFTRALLAVYCRGHAHLHSIGLTIASTCEKEDLIDAGGQQGAALYEQSRGPRRDLLKLIAQDLV
jgi:hypothetical protein